MSVSEQLQGVTEGEADPGLEVPGPVEPPTFETREAWLGQAVYLFKHSVEKATACTLPPIKVACGFPARKALARKNRAIGECWGREATASETAHVFVSPLVDDPVEVLAVLIHELSHAALPAKIKHGRAFAIAIKKLGLEGKPTETKPGLVFDQACRDKLLPLLGTYPHTKFEPVMPIKKQSTRLRLYECDCPVKVRVASDGFDATCNLCEGAFKRVDGEASNGNHQ